MGLRQEVSYLTSQLDFLRSRHRMLRSNGQVAEWEERAMAQRRKRHKAEELNQQLRQAIFQQSGFIKNSQLFFANAPLQLVRDSGNAKWTDGAQWQP